MKYYFRYILSSIILSVAATGAGHAQNILNVSESSLDSKLIMPESCETDVKAMLEDWYLKNYTVLDYEPQGNPGDLSDEVIMTRLANMPTVIEMPFNSVVKGAIRFYANRPQLVENLLGLSLYYMPIFVEALERHKMPLELKYLPVIESALNPSAVSKAGAAGLWQFMTPTAGGLGLEVNSLVDQRRDPYLSSDAAARYLKQLYQTYNDWSLAIAAYNCGPGNVNKALRRAGEGKHDFWEIYPFLPSETRGYVPTFIAANYIMNYHKDHNISPALARRPLITDTVHVSKRVHFDQISQVLDIPVAELRALNPQFRKDLIPGDIKPYSLVLPSMQAYAYIVNEDSIVNHNAAKYARRGVVEPASGASVGRDARGEYYDEETTKWHTVKRGETLASIARKYGVTTASIQKYNKVGKKVKVGKKLKIVTVQRKYKETTPEVTVETTTSPETVADTTTVALTTDSNNISSTDSVDTSKTAEVSKALSQTTETPKQTQKETAAKEKPKAEKTTAKPTPKKATTEQKSQKSKATATTHTVVKGENLYKISKRYGVTIDQIKKANNLKGDALQIGQKLKIPTK